jgi:hypothetical protein
MKRQRSLTESVRMSVGSTSRLPKTLKRLRARASQQQIMCCTVSASFLQNLQVGSPQIILNTHELTSRVLVWWVSAHAFWRYGVWPELRPPWQGMDTTAVKLQKRVDWIESIPLCSKLSVKFGLYKYTERGWCFGFFGNLYCELG